MSAVVDFVSDAVSAVGDAVGSVVEAAGDIVTSVVDNVVEPVADAVGKVVDSAMQDPIGTIAKVATAIVAPELLPLVSAADTVAHGGDLGDALQSAATTYVAQGVGSYVNSAVDVAVANDLAPESLNAAGNVIKGSAADIAGNVAGSTAAGIVRGQDPLQALMSSGISAGTSAVTAQIPGFSELPSAAQRAVASTVSAALSGGDPSQALVNAAINAGIAEARAQYNSPSDMGMGQIGAASGSFQPSSTYGDGSGAIPTDVQVASTDQSYLPTSGTSDQTQSMLDAMKNIESSSASNTAPDWVNLSGGESIVGTKFLSDGSLAYTIERTNPNDPSQTITYDVVKDPETGEVFYKQGGWNLDEEGNPAGGYESISGTKPSYTWDTEEGGLPTTKSGDQETTTPPSEDINLLDASTSKDQPAQQNEQTQNQNTTIGALPTAQPVTQEQVQNIVRDALQSNPTLTQDQVQQIVSNAITQNPGLSASDVSNIVNQNISDVRSGLSSLGETVAQNQQQNTQSFADLSDAQQRLAQDLINQGVSTNDAIARAQAQSADQLQSGLSGLSAEFRRQIEQSDAATRASFEGLSAAQQAEAAARVAQGDTLQKSIADVQSGLSGQIQSGLSGLSADFQGRLAASDAATQERFNSLSDEQKALAASLTASTGSLSDAINQVAQQSQSGLSGLQSQLTAQGQQLMDTLRQQGVDYNTALREAIDAQNNNFANYQSATEQALGGLGQQIGDVAASNAQGIAGVQSGLDALSTNFQNQLAGLDSATQARFSSLDDNQKALAASLAATSGDLQSAIDEVASSNAEQISGLSETINQNQQNTNTAIGNLTTNVNSQISGVNNNLNAVKSQVSDQAASAAMQNASKWLDTTPQMIKAASTQQNPARMAQLKQLYGSLTPELRSVLADRGVAEPQNEPSQPSFEDGFAAGGSTAQSVMDSLTAKFSKAPTILEAAPVQQQQARLQALRHIYDGLKSRQAAPAMARGGLPTKYREAAPDGHNPEFVTGLTGYYAAGRGTGQSDDIPAMLHDGDYVMDAEAVSALGDGSSKAGAQALARFQQQVPHRDGGPVNGNPIPAKIADGEYVFPEAFVTALGGGDNKQGAQMLDAMRETLRAHKRSAPTSKIPPKAKSPLDYLKMAKG